jgi:hypothetical protein
MPCDLHFRQFGAVLQGAEVDQLLFLTTKLS